ncbi:hypothetical protein [Methanofollis fontis]|uniref:Uncharacterized protein n=1 Tax=Methanofollis fontis TaxID=2052832 RepID=A0A483CTN7_9EURY|nr:hypothetical protein [Methanofollis fontis]TAJ44648.1 hypothetical protein CUJ86_04905 [Methanofollis fontis]
MDPRLLDVITGVGSLLVFIAMLIVLPSMIPGSLGIAYILALIIFMVLMSGAGYIINDKIT